MPSSWFSTALISLALGVSGPTPGAEITGERWTGLRSEPEQPPGPLVLDRTLTIEVVPGGILLRGRWRLTTGRPGWFASVLVQAGAHVRRATFNGRPARTWGSPTGVVLVERVAKDAVVELEAFVPGSVGSGLGLEVLGAPRGVVEIAGDGDLHVVDAAGLPVLVRDARFVTGSANLRLEPKAVATVDARTVAIAQVGVGLTVGDAELRGRGRLRWAVRRGRLESVSFVVENVGTDLQVEGPNVAGWTRKGDRIEVELREPAASRVDVDVSWSRAVSKAAESRTGVPRLEPQDVFRVESALQLARDGEVDVVPTMEAWSPIAAAQLPTWATGLVAGNPTAAYRRAGAQASGSELSLLRYVPVPGPSMVIDVADIRVASSVEGRYVMRARYEVRNERAAHLELTPPPGSTLLGVTVAGEAVRATLVDDAYRIPLPRSLETVDGLAPVPVVVGLRGDDAAWGRRAKGVLALPTVDAPISVVRGEHILPRRYRSRLRPSDGAVVDAFSRGHGVAYGLRDDQRVSQADQVFNQAVIDWNENEFERAREKLRQLESIGASNDGTRGLESNVDLVMPEEPAPAPTTGVPVTTVDGEPVKVPAPRPKKAESLVTRRIKAQARARSAEKQIRFRRRKKKAADLKASGKYDEAEDEYEKALEEAKDLDKLEDEESQTYDFAADEVEAELEDTRTQRANREVLESSQGTDVGEYDFVSSGLDFGFAPLLAQREEAESLPPPVVPVLVPQAGEVVRHELLLLEAGARRTLEFDARRRTRKRSR